MGWFRRAIERIRSVLPIGRTSRREQSPPDRAPSPGGGDYGGDYGGDGDDFPSDSELDDEFAAQGWDGWDIKDAYHVIEAAIDDMYDRGSL